MSNVKIKNHKLHIDGSPVTYIKTPNVSGKINPKYGVIHYTAGESMKGAVNWFKQKKAKASSQLLLDFDGTWVQMAPLNVKTWHAGKSQWDGIKYLNGHSIGIEVINPGPLKIMGDGTYKSWFGKIYSVADYPDIIEARHENGGAKCGWIPFTPEQIKELISVCSELTEAYDLREWVGHDMISPRRKTDPGPCLPPNVYSYLNGRQEDSYETDAGYEVFNAKGGLNIRRWPSLDSTPLETVSPIANGTRVEKIRTKGKWWLVGLEGGQEGWVHSNWLKRV